MDADDRALFERSLRHAAAAATTPAELDAALDDLGWTEALAADPRDAVAVLFEVQGESNATSSALVYVVGSALGIEPAACLGLVLPPLGRTVAPGVAAGERVAVAGLALGTLLDRPDATATVVVAENAQNTVVAAGQQDLALRPVTGLDPALSLVEVTGGVERATPQQPSPRPAAVWEDAVAAGQRAIAHELLGAARAMLQLARDHALERIQFGRPIAAFQAVRHRLAESLVTIEAAAAALEAAWDDPSPWSASLAKAVAGRAARTVARHAQQVLAGIGFTTEHPLHRHLRRSLVLDQLLGSTRTLTHTLGDDILHSGRLPALLPL